MRKLALVGAAAASLALALTLAATALGGGTVTRLKATLTAGAEVPKQAVPAMNGKGVFTATLASPTSITWKLTFSGLSGPAIAAHIHVGGPGVSGPITIPLCGGKIKCRSGMTGKASVSDVQRSGLLKGADYVNVHTAKNPNGEIRGQLKTVM